MLLNCGIGEDSWKSLWTARRSNQSTLKNIRPECSLERLMLKLKLQYFSHLMQRTAYWKRRWCWERLKVRGEEDNRGWDGWMASPTQWTWVWVSSRSWWWTGKPGVLQSVRSQRVRHDWATELNWLPSLKLYSTFPCKVVGKVSDCNVGDLVSISGSRRSLGERNGNPLQYSCLENVIEESGRLQGHKR